MNRTPPEQLLAEVEDLLRNTSSLRELQMRRESALSWLGRVTAAIQRWKASYMPVVTNAADDVQYTSGDMALFRLQRMLHEARADLQMELGRGSIIVPQGQVFDYFDELRKVIETARSEVFFVDPYLDTDFVSRYLPHVHAGVAVRLLGKKRMAALLPAVDLFAKQSGLTILVRSCGDFHDRYLFVDGAQCYLSGASRTSTTSSERCRGGSYALRGSARREHRSHRGYRVGRLPRAARRSYTVITMATKTRIVRIGNSRGIRIPKTLLDEANLPEEVELHAQPGRLVVQAARHPRTGWAAAAKRMRARRDDRLLDESTSTTFDREEWEWQ